MSYIVFARKYRPQSFEEVIGQEAVATTLANAIRSDRVAQAYLFSGQRGVGKTTMARIFAKTLNCPEAEDASACNACESCRSIMLGENTDVVEIDGASNNSVDNIRDLRENVKYAPMTGRFKIYVIDEVHMLSKSAFNALLKTLEEPPEHVKFIFATTEPHHVPDTIHSRCQRFDFRAVPAAKIADLLGRIADAEGAKVERRVLESIARRAGGSVRDAESYLDQLLAYKPKSAGYADYLTVFGLTAEEKLLEWFRACAEGRVADAIELVGSSADEGADTAQLGAQMAEMLRAALLSIGGVEVPQEGLKEVAASVGLDWILYALQVIQTALRDLRGGADGRLALEMASARIASLGEMVSLDEISARLEALASGTHAAGCAAPGSARGDPPGRAAAAPVAPRGSRSARGTAPIARAAAPAASQAEVLERWGDLVKEISAGNKMLAGMFGSGAVLEVTAEKVVVGFGSESEVQLEHCQEQFDVIYGAAKKVLGLDVELVRIDGAPRRTESAARPAPRNRASSEEIERVRKAFDGTVIREQ